MKLAHKPILMLLCPIIILVALLSCATQHGYQNRTSNGKYIDVFPLSENATQYFVHPIEWKIKEMSIGIDFTIRTHRAPQPNDPVTFCYTLVKETPFLTDPFISFIIDDTTAVTPSMIESLATDDNSRYVRYSSQIVYYDFLKMLWAKRIDMIILVGMDDLRIKMPKEFFKAAKELQQMLQTKM